MEASSVLTLVLAAISIGFIHTILGPDHYLPFIALARSNRWSFEKTMLISSLSGVAHCLSSVLLGFLGIGLGLAIGRVEWIEGFRGNLASYAMIAFGLIYLAWALKRFLRNRRHAHLHHHGDLVHAHEHDHHRDHLHPHAAPTKSRNVSWAIFLVFLFGPCEPLIPLLMYPAAKASLGAAVIVALAFTLTTIGTMLAVIWAGYRGLSLARFPKLAPYSDLLASSAILGCGLLILIGF